MNKLSQFWKFISQNGLTSSLNTSFQRTIILSNRIAALLLITSVFLIISSELHSPGYIIKNTGAVRLVIIIIISIFSFFLIRYKQYLLAKISITFLPVFFLIYYPLLNHHVINEYFLWAPFAIAALSIKPHLLFDTHKEKWSFYVSLFYFFVLIVITDLLLIELAPPTLEIIPIIEKNYIYYKIASSGTFIFLQFTILYLVSLNKKSQKKLEKEVSESTSQLKESQERIEKLINNVPDGAMFIGYTDHKGNALNFSYASELFERITGVSTKEITSDAKNLFSQIHPDDLPKVIEHQKEQGKRLENFDMIFRLEHKKTKEQKWIHSHANPQQLADDTIMWDGIAIDVTKHKNTEKKLKQSTSLLNAIIENIPFDIWAKDPAGKVILQNKASKKIWGDTVGKFAKDKDNLKKYDKEWTQRNKQVMQGRIINNEQVYEINNEERVVDSIVCPIYIEEKVTGVLGINIDITERKKIETKLRVSRDRLSFALIATNDGLWDWNLKTGEAYFSDRYYSMLGYEPGEFEGNYKNWRKLLHPDDLEAAETNLNNHLEDKCEMFEIEFRLRTKNNKWKWILGRGRTMERDAQGNPVRMVGTHIDISERKKAEERIKNSEQNFRNIFEQAVDGILIGNEKGEIINSNKGFKLLTGYSLFDIKNQHISYFFPKHILNEKPLRFDLLKQGKSVINERVIKNKQGKNIPIEMHSKLLSDGRYQTFIRDISERKKAEEQLKQINQELLSAEEELRASNEQLENKNEQLQKANKQLKISEQKFIKIFQVGPSLSFICSLDNNEIIDINDSFLTKTGYERGDLKGKKITKTQLFDDNEYREINQLLIQNKKYQNQDIRLTTKSGQIIQCIASAEIIEIQNQQAVIHIFNDITARMEAEKKIKQRNELIKNIQKGIATKIGKDFFKTTIQQLANVLNADYTFIGEINLPDKKTINTLAYYKKGIFADNFEYKIKNTPTEQLLNGTIYFCLKTINQKFSDDDLLKQMNAEGYIGSPLFNSQGKVIGVLVAIFEKPVENEELGKQMLEIFSARAGTELERTQTERALIESENKYRELFESANDSIVLAKDDILVDCNQKTLKIFEASREEILGKTLFDVSPEKQPDGELSKKKGLKKIRAAEIGHPQRFEWVHKTMKGRNFIAEITLNKVTINQAYYFQAIIRDITRQKEIEQEINQHRNHLEELVEERTEEIQELNTELLQTNEQLQKANTRLEKQKKVLENALKKLRKTQSQLIQSEKMASLGVLTAGLAHEINNPVNFISSGMEGIKVTLDSIQLIVKQIKKITPENYQKIIKELDELKKETEFEYLTQNAEQVINNTFRGIERVSEIIKGLQTFSRLEVDEVQPTNVYEIIDSTLTILHHQYKKRIEIIKNYNKIPLIKAIPGKLNQVFMNIISNAIQAIDGKGKIFITTDSIKQNKFIRITIKDTGKGIPPESMEKIFEPFFTTKPVGKGTGLGLAISYNIIKQHQGKITVQSDDTGSTFIIELPEKLNIPTGENENNS